MGCSPFEVNSGCTPNSVWHTIAKCALSSNLSWRNVLYSLDRNKQMFPHELCRKTQAPDDDTTLGMYNRVVHTLAESTPFSCGELCLTDQQKGCHIFRKNQERLKLQPNFEYLNERTRRESDHFVALDSGKVVHKFGILISLGGFDSEPTDPRKKAALHAAA